MDGDNPTTDVGGGYTIICSCVIVDGDNSTTDLGGGYTIICSCVIVNRDNSTIPLLLWEVDTQ